MTTQVSTERLISFIERIERVEKEISKMKSYRKEIYSEAKGEGYDVKSIRTIVKLRTMNQFDGYEQKAPLDLYINAFVEGLA